eukprot:c47621_g1_i1 orf=1-222(-)
MLQGTPFPSLNLWNWHVLSGSLQTGDRLRNRIDISGLCPWCKVAKETPMHLFWACPAVRKFWSYIRNFLSLVFG